MAWAPEPDFLCQTPRLAELYTLKVRTIYNWRNTHESTAVRNMEVSRYEELTRVLYVKSALSSEARLLILVLEASLFMFT